MSDYIMNIEGKAGKGGADHADADGYGVDNGPTTTYCGIAQFTFNVRDLLFVKTGPMFQSSKIWVQ